MARNSDPRVDDEGMTPPSAPHSDKVLRELVSPANLKVAWGRVHDNHGCAGVDGVSIEDFAFALGSNLGLLSEDLSQQAYSPLPLLRILINKGNGESRALSVPAVRDRIAQAATLNMLEPRFEAEFEHCSFAYRRGRSWQQAVYQVREYYQQGYHWVVDADIDAFFDSVPHDKLLSKVEQLVSEKSLRRLISLWVKAEVWDGEQVLRLAQGIPQGSVISPMLANLYLDELDEELLSRGIRLVRYADDFLVLCKSKEKAQEALKLTEQILEQMSLGLDEADIIHFDQGFRFLGVIFCRSSTMVPFGKEKKAKRVLYMPPPLNLNAYRAGLLSYDQPRAI